MATDHEIDAAGRVIYPNTWDDPRLPEIAEERRKVVGRAVDAAAMMRQQFAQMSHNDLRALLDAMRKGDAGLRIDSRITAHLFGAALMEVDGWLTRCNEAIMAVLAVEISARTAVGEEFGARWAGQLRGAHDSGTEATA